MKVPVSATVEFMVLGIGSIAPFDLSWHRDRKNQNALSKPYFWAEDGSPMETVPFILKS